MNSFEALARDWFDVNQGGWAPGYSEKIIARLRTTSFVDGSRAVAPSRRRSCSRCCAGSRARGVVETAHRALENCSQVFRYGMAVGQATTNPARDLKDALQASEAEALPAITDPGRFGNCCGPATVMRRRTSCGRP